MQFRWERSVLVAVLFAAVVTAMVLPGCATTDKARKTTTTGFLGDYSQLTPGTEDEAQLLYINPAVKFGDYSFVMIDPITVYASEEDSNLANVPEDELQALVDYLDATVRDHLRGDYTIVDTAAPGTMRLRIAMTEAKGAGVVLSATSSITPVGIAMNGLKKAVTGASTGVGTTGIEMELLDATTGARLAAAVDERVGTKSSSFQKWESAKESYDYWAERLKSRLWELRAK